jgi:Pilus formation protein N terminal region
MSKFSRITTGILLASFIASSAAVAGELIVKTDETMLIKLSGAPGTIVIGNPSIADATLEAGNLFIQGKSFGSTNLIVLDGGGNQLASYNITVQMGGDNNVALFNGGPRYSYTCAPLCEAAMQPGDEKKFVEGIMSVNESKSNFAKGISNQDSNGSPTNGGGNSPAQ